MAKKEEIKHILEMLGSNKITAEQAANLISALTDSDEDVKNGIHFDTGSIKDVVTQMAEMSKNMGQLGARIGHQLMDDMNIPDFGKEPFHVKKMKYILNDDAGIQVDVSGKINIYQQNEGTDEVLLFIRHNESTENKLNEYLVLNSSQNNLNIILDKTCKKTVGVDLHIPAIHLNRVVLIGRNKNVTISGIMAKILEVATINGRIEGEDIQSDRLNVTTSNGRVELSGCKGETLKVTSANSNIELKNNTFYDEVSAVSTNGFIKLKNQESSRMIVNSTNGNLTVANGFCDLMKMTSTNGSVFLTNMTTKYSPKCEIEAVSGNGDINVLANRDSELVFEARTENGQIIIADSSVKTVKSEKIGNRIIKASGHSLNNKKESSMTEMKLKTFIGMINIDWFDGGL
ncbi:MAG: DUF4097 family beta strand repeat protein [Clostridia bacterium]|nr:DUF4097 family beta strand repeat protein [Clostridia bacterium]